MSDQPFEQLIAVSTKALARVKELEDGIAAHRDGIGNHANICPVDEDDRLWSLLIDPEVQP